MTVANLPPTFKAFIKFKGSELTSPLIKILSKLYPKLFSESNSCFKNFTFGNFSLLQLLDKK